MIFYMHIADEKHENEIDMKDKKGKRKLTQQIAPFFFSLYQQLNKEEKNIINLNMQG